MVNRFTSVSTALTVKVVGIICILSFFVDFLILLLDFSPTNKVWQIGFTTALVDRGIVPLVGLGLLFAGYWIDSTDAGNDRPQVIDLRFPALILSSVLGIMFFGIVFLHSLNVSAVKTQTLEQIRQEAEQAENQLNNRLSQLQAQLNTEQGKAQLEQLRNQTKAQFTELLKDEQRYKQALESSQIPPAIKDLLKKAKTDPQVLDTAIAQQTDIQTLRNQQLSQIRQRKEDGLKQAENNASRSGLRITISSFLLSIGYIIIGWTGLRGRGALQGRKPRATAR